MLEVSPEIEKTLNDIIGKYFTDEGNVISLLQDIEDAFGYIPEDAVSWFSKKLDMPESSFFGVITFYAQFHLKPRGENLITACCGTACHVKGSDRLIAGIFRELNIPEGENTTEDGQFTVEKVACVGACSIAPVIIFNKKVLSEMTIHKLLKHIKVKSEIRSEHEE